MKSAKFYLERAGYMRQLARDGLTEKPRESCTKSAELYEQLAKAAAEEGEKGK